ncbi:helix-turn-helix domain-containing protein [Amycolatopsis sp. cmx-4-54]|uniref:helix-turn-helix domain-containing protein n=1 Tax=Amycolatopsis sp. cmx-4-54 TaxID=2790936 RepID=UPI00397B7F69
MARQAGRPRRELGNTPTDLFAGRLRELTEAAGMRGQVDIARRANISGSTAAAAIRGERLPTWDTTKAIVWACDESVPDWRNDWITTREKAELAGQSPPKCPPGLLDETADPRPAPIAAPAPPCAPTVEAPVPADEPHFPDEHDGASGTRLRSRLRPSRWRRGLLAAAIGAVVVAGVGIRVVAGQEPKPPTPDCDAIGVAYTGVAAHRVHPGKPGSTLTPRTVAVPHWGARTHGPSRAWCTTGA